MSYIFYGIFVVGILFLTMEDLRQTMMLRNRQGRSKTKNKIVNHIYKVVKACYDNKTDDWVRGRSNAFFGGSIFIYILCMLCIFRIGAMQPPLFLLAAFAACMPYLWLRVKLSTKQIAGSYEGQIVISEILNQYKMNSNNITEAIERSLGHLEGAPIARHLLFRMGRQLRLYRSRQELSEILDDFAFSANTGWARMLAQNIYTAVQSGTDVTEGLQSLLKECEYIKDILEKRKRSSNEAFAIIKVLCPAAYLVLMWTLVKYFDFSIGDILYFQFSTPNGLLFFFILVVMAFVNMAFIRIMSRPKFDF